LEHPEIVTIGPRARNDGIAPPSDYQSHPVDRGGGLTWHGPGQLVVYPIIHWNKDDEKSVADIISKIESWVIASLEDLGIKGYRDERMQGVWVDGKKICSIGLSFLRWVSRHGFTINYDTPIGRVENLAGCGLQESTTTSLRELNYKLNRKNLQDSLIATIPEVLNR
jgi:lipoate-protein ligase B